MKGLEGCLLAYVEQAGFKIQQQFRISMWAPLTPTPRKSSLKKIIISSPSQQILHFLNLPNPSAIEDPRSRIHILTPKIKHRSLSRSEIHQPIKSPFFEKAKSTLPNRNCFIRKKANQTGWKKMEVKFRSEKLQIKNCDHRIVSSLCSSQSSESTEEPKRLDMTFGAEGFWNCIKV